jgi:hypothetical protein
MSCHFILADHVRRLSDEDGAVVLNVKNGKYYSLNSMGDQICDALTSATDVDSIVGRIAARCGSVPEAVRADVESFLEQLRASGLVEAR